MKCPKCSGECERDEADIGIGTIGGPWGCPACQWVEEKFSLDVRPPSAPPPPPGLSNDELRARFRERATAAGDPGTGFLAGLGRPSLSLIERLEYHLEGIDALGAEGAWSGSRGLIREALTELRMLAKDSDCPKHGIEYRRCGCNLPRIPESKL